MAKVWERCKDKSGHSRARSYLHFRMSIQLVVVKAVSAAVAAAITMRSSASQTLRFMIQDSRFKVMSVQLYVLELT